MFPIALLGADGSGKSTVTRSLLPLLPAGTQTIYMGVRLESSNRLLPTSKLILAAKRRLGVESDSSGPPPLQKEHSQRRTWADRIYTGARVFNLIAEEWYRLALAAYHHWRGRVVLFDRDFFADHYFHGIADPSGKNRLERLHLWTLRRFYPRPRLVILLDAPAELLLERKREGSIEALDSRRREYLSLETVLPNVYVVDAAQPLEAVIAQTSELIRQHHPFCAAKGTEGGS